MLEYASMRFTFDCTSATTFPTVIVAAATAANSIAHSGCAAGNAVWNTRIAAAKPAAFDATERYAVTGVGAPSYTSGVHIWNGTAATLNPSPAVISASASPNAGGSSPNRATAAFRSGR